MSARFSTLNNVYSVIKKKLLQSEVDKIWGKMEYITNAVEKICKKLQKQ